MFNAAMFQCCNKNPIPCNYAHIFETCSLIYSSSYIQVMYVHIMRDGSTPYSHSIIYKIRTNVRIFVTFLCTFVLRGLSPFANYIIQDRNKCPNRYLNINIYLSHSYKKNVYIMQGIVFTPTLHDLYTLIHRLFSLFFNIMRPLSLSSSFGTAFITPAQSLSYVYT